MVVHAQLKEMAILAVSNPNFWKMGETHKTSVFFILNKYIIVAV